MNNPFEFWFAIGSTYTYLSVMRIEEVTREAGISVVWRPFNLREIMVEMNNIPFVTKPVKEAYMWRDLERRANKYKLPINLPVAYPLKEFDLPNKIAALASSEGWVSEFVRATYSNWFMNGLEPGQDSSLSKTLDELGKDKPLVLANAQDADVSSAYVANTAQARSKGIFGSPTFSIGNELFWGDDRLEDAIEYYLRTQ